MTWWVVVNPGAGRGRHTASRVEAALDGAGVAGTVHVADHGTGLAATVAAGLERGHERFVAVGGDGTVNEVANELLRQRPGVAPTLGVLPAGSGCDLLRTFGIPQGMEEAARHLAGDAVYEMDVGVLEGPWGLRYFLNVATAGLGGAVVRVASRLPDWLGKWRYRVGIWPALAVTPRRTITLDTERRGYEGPATLLVFANAQFFGGGMNVAPKASVVDGKLDVQIFTGRKWEALALQPRVARGTHLGHRHVLRRVTGRFTLRGEMAVEADGEYVGRAGELRGSVIPGGLRLKI